MSRYALGRDYHKVMRRALQAAGRAAVAELAGPHGYRVFVDSAPVLEKALARNAGLGWIGKHTNLIARDAGSWFFLGEIFTDLPLPPDSAGERALRQLLGLHSGLPDRRHRGALSARCAPLHFLPDDRTGGPDSASRCAPPWAIASTAAMTASWCVRGTNSRATPRTPIFACATRWIRRA